MANEAHTPKDDHDLSLLRPVAKHYQLPLLNYEKAVEQHVQSGGDLGLEGLEMLGRGGVCFRFFVLLKWSLKGFCLGVVSGDFGELALLIKSVLKF